MAGRWWLQEAAIVSSSTRPSQAVSPSAANLATICRRGRSRPSNARLGSEEGNREKAAVPRAHQQRPRQRLGRLGARFAGMRSHWQDHRLNPAAHPSGHSTPPPRNAGRRCSTPAPTTAICGAGQDIAASRLLRDRRGCCLKPFRPRVSAVRRTGRLSGPA